MAKNTVYRFLNHCQGRKLVLNEVKEKSRERRFTGRISALATVLDRRSGRSSKVLTY
jgi:hypothetical protein